VIFLFPGCQLKENYVTEYGFNDELVVLPKLQTEENRLLVGFLLVDLGCRRETFKILLDRDKNKQEFLLVINGIETEERCSKNFYTKIFGISEGEYNLKVIYKKSENDQQVVLYKKFSIK
jgi:hypothetical protein